jgi:hypothetical protein
MHNVPDNYPPAYGKTFTTAGALINLAAQSGLPQNPASYLIIEFVAADDTAVLTMMGGSSITITAQAELERVQIRGAFLAIAASTTSGTVITALWQ